MTRNNTVRNFGWCVTYSRCIEIPMTGRNKSSQVWLVCYTHSSWVEILMTAKKKVRNFGWNVTHILGVLKQQ